MDHQKSDPPLDDGLRIILQHEFASGSQDALARLLTSYRQALLTSAKHLVGSTLAEDLLQDVFLTLRTKSDRYNPDQHFVPWARQALYYLGISLLRRQSKTAQLQMLESADHTHPAHSADRDWTSSDLDQALAGLDGDDRHLLQLRYVEHLTLVQIASATNRSASTVRRCLTRVLCILRDTFARQGASRE